MVEMLTPQDVSRITGLSLETLAQWRSKKIHLHPTPAHKVEAMQKLRIFNGGHKRFRVSAQSFRVDYSVETPPKDAFRFATARGADSSAQVEIFCNSDDRAA
jgi:hypothetical protein